MNQPAVSKQPPFDLKAEMGVLGSILLDISTFPTVKQFIQSPDYFYSKKHQDIWTTCLKLHKEGIPFDPITLPNHLKSLYGFGEAESFLYLSEITYETPTSAHAEHYARIVAQKWQTRQQIRVLESALGKVNTGQVPIPLAMLRNEIFKPLELSVSELSPEEMPGLVRLENVIAEKIEWFWPPYIPLGKITLLDGDPGTGKSLFSVDLIARCSNGQAMPDGKEGITGGAVLLALEDGLADTVVPRIEAAGGDKKRVVALQSVPAANGNLRLPNVQDIEHIAGAIEKINAKLVIIDPLMAYLGGEVNSWRDQDIRQALSPLVKMAEEKKVAVLVIRHLNKSSGAQSMYRGGGSIGIIGLARAGLLIAKDPGDNTKRILAGIKSNLAPLPPALAFSISEINGTPKITWIGSTNHTADDLLAIPATPEEKSALDDAKDFLLAVLADEALDAKILYQRAKETGISEKTLRRAKGALSIVSEKEQFGGGWKWRLPDEGGQKYEGGQGGQYIKSDHLGNSLAIFDKNSLPVPMKSPISANAKTLGGN